MDIIGAFSCIKNNQGKTPLDWSSITQPNSRTCVEYMSKHAIGEYRHSSHKIMVFDKDIVSSLNTYSTYPLLNPSSAQSCGICYMDSVGSDIWVCHVVPDTEYTPLLKLLMSGPMVMAAITVDFSISRSTDQAICKVISQVSLAKQLTFRNEPVSLRIFSPHDNQSLFKTICAKVIANQKNDSIQFSQ